MSSYIEIPASFDPKQTLNCGQAFRWTEDGDGWWHGVARGRYLRLRRNEDTIIMECSQSELDSLWHDYLDLATDYAAIRRGLSQLDPVMKSAAEFAPGIHILRQDPWEALCSFIISQNNNIPRIQLIIERLCEMFGERISDSEFYNFPSAEKLATLTVDDLAPIKAGFRAKYMIDAARKVTTGEVDFAKVAAESVDFGRAELQKIVGVGPKVAECSLLYGFHKMECFPIDVWMKRAMSTLLPNLTPESFGEHAGIAQQYIFHYSRMHPELFE